MSSSNPYQRLHPVASPAILNYFWHLSAANNPSLGIVEVFTSFAPSILVCSRLSSNHVTTDFSPDLGPMMPSRLWWPLWLDLISTISRTVFNFYHSRRLGSTSTFRVLIWITTKLGYAVDEFFFTLEATCGAVLQSLTLINLSKVPNLVLRGYISACYWTTVASLLWLWAQPIQATIAYFRQAGYWEEFVIAFAILVSYVYSGCLEHMLFGDSPRLIFPFLPVTSLLNYFAWIYSHPLLADCGLLNVLTASCMYASVRSGTLGRQRIIHVFMLWCLQSYIAWVTREVMSVELRKKRALSLEMLEGDQTGQ